MTILAHRNMAAGLVRRVMGSVSVVRGHGMPEILERRGEGIGHDEQDF